MSLFLVGLIMLLVGLAGVFWGYRIFRILLPLMAGVAGYLVGLVLFPNNLFLALVVGFGLALVFIILAYAAWSIWVTISGIVLEGLWASLSLKVSICGTFWGGSSSWSWRL